MAAAKAGLDRNELHRQFPRVHEIPFTSETKRMTTLHESPHGIVAYSKGAPEVILNSCKGQLTERGEVIFDPSEKEAVLLSARQMASEALRVLAVAQKTDVTIESAEKEMIFLGLLGMIDPPRLEAKGAVQVCKDAGIKPVMITGDLPLTAQAIARELGILNHGSVVTGV